jgi:predicted amidohydrolase
MKDIRVAAAQIGSRVGDLDGNLAKHRDFAGRAAAVGAQVLCFPELSLCGYPLDGPIPHHLACALDSEHVEGVRAVAQELGLVLLVGLLERSTSGVLYNTQLLVGPAGLLEAYRKTHVPTSEIGRFRPGHELPVFHLEHAVVGVQVCYDSHFPEATTVQALAGAEIIFMPHASGAEETYEAKRARWLRYLPARAYDNAIFVVVVNQCDPDRGFPGVSFALDPWGAIVAEAAPNEEDLLVADFSQVALTERRAEAETFFLHFRRPDLYMPVTG